MEEQVEFQPAYAMLTLSLAAGETVRVEPGAMVAQENVTMETKSSGGFFKGLKKAVLGGRVILPEHLHRWSRRWVGLSSTFTTG